MAAFSACTTNRRGTQDCRPYAFWHGRSCWSGKITTFLQSLRKAFAGSKGKTLHTEVRWAGDNAQRFPTSMPMKLVSSTPDVILASSSASVAVLQQVTRKIPIVFANVADPGRCRVRQKSGPARRQRNRTPVKLVYSISGKMVELQQLRWLKRVSNTNERSITGFFFCGHSALERASVRCTHLEYDHMRRQWPAAIAIGMSHLRRRGGRRRDGGRGPSGPPPSGASAARMNVLSSFPAGCSPGQLVLSGYMSPMDPHLQMVEKTWNSYHNWLESSSED